MDYEKAYKDALKRAKNLHKDAIDMGENIRAKQCEIIFPELKESEDEMVRKAIHIYLDWLDGRKDYAPKGEYSIKDMLAWLEKQGGQKPAWSALDEINLQGIIDEIEANKNFAPESDLVTYDRYLSWLKSIRTKNTWKPSDEQMDALETAVSSLQSNTLKSLYQHLKREKNHE